MHSTRQLALLAALDEHRHFGRAALALRLSQPALTKALRALEDSLGVTLFDRGPPVAPTAIGAVVIQRAAGLVAGFEDLRREVALVRGLDTGTLRVSAGGQVAEFAAIDAVAALSRAHPRVAVTLQIGDHLSVTQDVLQGRADLGIAHLADAVRHDELAIERLRVTGYVVFCAPDHPLVALGDAVTTDMLLDYPWIGASALVPRLDYTAAGRRTFGEIDPDTGDVRLRLATNTFGAVLRIVMNSHALSAAPLRLVAEHIAAGRLARLVTPYGWAPLDYGIITRRGRTPSPAAEAYCALLRKLEAAIPQD